MDGTLSQLVENLLQHGKMADESHLRNVVYSSLASAGSHAGSYLLVMIFDDREMLLENRAFFIHSQRLAGGVKVINGRAVVLLVNNYSVC